MMRDRLRVYADVTRNVDYFKLDLYVPRTDRDAIKSEEEFHGYIISKVEALMAKGADSDE